MSKQLQIPGIGGVLCGELIVDLFAGGGGASLGIELALGRSPDIAINHDPHAIQMHEANHPATCHYCESIYDVRPEEATKGVPVGALWLSPDYRHFSRAKGSAPVSPSVRALAWIGCRWAAKVAPRVIFLENVPEFLSWGPLMYARDAQGDYLRDPKDGKPIRVPDPARAGETFKRFVDRLRALKYSVEWRTMVAADYGVPTIRKRLFLVARRDGAPIVWPVPTHGKGRAEAWRPAADIIDWSLRCPSIFERKKPLADATCRRVAAGMVRYVLSGNPFIVTIDQQSNRRGSSSVGEPLSTVTQKQRHGLVAPRLERLSHGDDQRNGVHDPLTTTLAQGNHPARVAAFLSKYYGSLENRQHHCKSLTDPLPTITKWDHNALAAMTLVQTGYGERVGQAPRALDIRQPLGTVVAGGSKAALVAAFLTKYYGTGGTAQGLDDPLHTIRQGACFGLVTVTLEGEEYLITDIGLRMLEAEELAGAQGFGRNYILTGTKRQKTARIGNSVYPPVAAAIVAAQFGIRLRLAA